MIKSHWKAEAHNAEFEILALSFYTCYSQFYSQKFDAQFWLEKTERNTNIVNLCFGMASWKPLSSEAVFVQVLGELNSRGGG